MENNNNIILLNEMLIIALQSSLNDRMSDRNNCTRSKCAHEAKPSELTKLTIEFLKLKTQPYGIVFARPRASIKYLWHFRFSADVTHRLNAGSEKKSQFKEMRRFVLPFQLLRTRPLLLFREH